SLFVAFFAAVGVSLSYPRTDEFEMPRLIGLFIGGALVFVVGVYDDHRELAPAPQLIAQIIAAIIVAASGVLIREVSNPFPGHFAPFETWFAFLFTLFWLVGMMNTINWLDGIDGLAAGVVVIAGFMLFAHTFHLGQNSLALLALALLGSVLGFLLFNFFPAQIFMGSAGANVLGLTLGALSIIGGAKVGTALLVLGIPILDVAWQIIQRVRAGKSPFSADRGHLHHRLLDLGVPQRAIVFLYYVLSSTFGALALILPNGIYKLIALVIIGLGAIALLVNLSPSPSKK
ncbi:MAG: undecaprenyl/decaprenyl-phosphate alpha-N-acetylglucosaminyl 1-phosphate transferase, partial [Anaerolineales bacterium]|nr:undecaprenyl/decaprenyl-phosphate alpha-N-acetylglucosaminyl 1-phosphate transferase [Anaerolineales bacterium]